MEAEAAARENSATATDPERATGIEGWTTDPTWVPLSIRGNAAAEQYHRQTQVFVADCYRRAELAREEGRHEGIEEAATAVRHFAAFDDRTRKRDLEIIAAIRDLARVIPGAKS